MATPTDPKVIADILAKMTAEDFDRLYASPIADMFKTGIGAASHGYEAGEPFVIPVPPEVMHDLRTETEIVITLDPTEYRRVK